MNKDKKDKVLINSVNLILGILMFLVGLLTAYTKTAGTRSGGTVQGIIPQIGGIVFICYGLYVIFMSIKKLFYKK